MSDHRTHLQPEFDEYLKSLPLTPHTLANYRQYVKWINQYGDGILTADKLGDRMFVTEFTDRLAARYNSDDHPTSQHGFNQARRRDTKCILGHYRRFLNGADVARRQEELDSKGEFDPGNATQAKERTLCSIALRRGQPKFRAELLKAYGGRCAITGTATEETLEAAHIVPYNGPSTNHVRNGLLLRSDVHALFDLGLISVDPDSMTIVCAADIQREPIYRVLQGKRLTLPLHTNHEPNPKALRSHFDRRVC